MTTYVLRRLALSVPTILGITVATFLLVHAAPGDPVEVLVFGAGGLTSEEVAGLRNQFGLDRPFLVQYFDWVFKLARLDMGNSFLTHQPVVSMVLDRLGNTLQLTIISLALSLLLGIPLGMLSAIKAGSLWDQISRLLAVLGSALPHFWLGLLSILVFSLWLRALPSGGMYTLGAEGFDVADRLKHLLLPAFVLATGGIAAFSRFVRTETLEVMRQDYVRTAHAKGLGARTVLARHVARNAALPVITLLGGSLERLFGGAVVVETVFSWPGIGRMGFDAATQKDYPVLMGLVLISSMLVVAGYLLGDIAYAWADPRIRNR